MADKRRGALEYYCKTLFTQAFDNSSYIIYNKPFYIEVINHSPQYSLTHTYVRLEKILKLTTLQTRKQKGKIPNKSHKTTGMFFTILAWCFCGKRRVYWGYIGRLIFQHSSIGTPCKCVCLFDISSM